MRTQCISQPPTRLTSTQSQERNDATPRDKPLQSILRRHLWGPSAPFRPLLAPEDVDIGKPCARRPYLPGTTEAVVIDPITGNETMQPHGVKEKVISRYRRRHHLRTDPRIPVPSLPFFLCDLHHTNAQTYSQRPAVRSGFVWSVTV